MRIRNIVQKYTREGVANIPNRLYRYVPVGQVNAEPGLQSNFYPDLLEAPPNITGAKLTIQIVGTRTHSVQGTQVFDYYNELSLSRVEFTINSTLSPIATGCGFDGWTGYITPSIADSLHFEIVPNPRGTGTQTLRRPRDPRFQRVQVRAAGTLSPLVAVGTKIGENTVGGVTTDILAGQRSGAPTGTSIRADYFPAFGNYWKGAAYNITTIRKPPYFLYYNQSGSPFYFGTTTDYDLIADGGYDTTNFRASDWTMGDSSIWPLDTGDGFVWDTSTVESFVGFSFITV